MKEAFKKYVKEHYALYLLFWPINFTIFFLTEHFSLGRAYVIHSVIDDMIPFNEWWMIFYVLWYPMWVLMLAYCFIREPESFRRMMRFFILTMSVCNICYIFFPTCIDFQPTSFERHNFLTWVTELIYRIDEPTNVLPSEHVIGAFATFFAAFDTKLLRRPSRSVPILILAVLVSISIMFTKQHSFWDLVAALPLCLIGWIVCFKPWKRENTESTFPSKQTS